MSLLTWKNAPDGRVLKQDVIIAKNYLQLIDLYQKIINKLLQAF